ncbi:hypothetical protein [Steroidobacter sp.]|uniref:hypothetical protein n=1 Tax=Steroidobacter sp. TaxID=1978227 RepID=UPI001A3EE834|nr:hypothetical protein [Steroidobacter sp.]MBL8268647.1 hypothetical protein [Steroidobacter sp.]
MKPTTTTKLWLSLGLATTLTSGCSERAEHDDLKPAAANVAAQPATSPEEFAKALEKLMAGEGGEGGSGGTYDNGKLVIHPWNGPQIQTALSGNSFRRGEDIAIDFKADGTFTGVEHPWVKADAAVCEQAGNAPGYEVHEGQCKQRTEVKFNDGRWTVRGGQLCTTPALPQAAESLECTQVFVAIDRIALFSPDGAMLSKGIELKKGHGTP